MEIDGNVDIGAERFPVRLDRFDSPIDLGPALDPFVIPGDSGLDACDPKFARSLAYLYQLIAVGSVHVVIAAHATGIVGTAEEFVNRHSEGFAANIPQGLVDTGDSRSHDGTGSVERVDVHRLPDVFHLHRIRTDEEVSEIVDAGNNGAGFSFERAFTPADQALIRLDFDEHIGAIGVRS